MTIFVYDIKRTIKPNINKLLTIIILIIKKCKLMEMIYRRWKLKNDYLGWDDSISPLLDCCDDDQSVPWLESYVVDWLDCQLSLWLEVPDDQPEYSLSLVEYWDSVTCELLFMNEV